MFARLKKRRFCQGWRIAVAREGSECHALALGAFSFYLSPFTFYRP